MVPLATHQKNTFKQPLREAMLCLFSGYARDTLNGH